MVIFNLNWLTSLLTLRVLDRTHSAATMLGHPGEPLRHLDIASGRGGDICRWSKANIAWVLGIDVSPESVRLAGENYDEFVVLTQTSSNP